MSHKPTGEVIATERKLSIAHSCEPHVLTDSNGQTRFYAITTSEAPAQGINPAMTTARFTAFNENLDEDWSVVLHETPTKDFNGCSDGNGQRPVRATADGQHIAFNLLIGRDPKGGYASINSRQAVLLDGEVRPVGRWIVAVDCSNCRERTATLIDPATATREAWPSPQSDDPFVEALAQFAASKRIAHGIGNDRVLIADRGTSWSVVDLPNRTAIPRPDLRERLALNVDDSTSYGLADGQWAYDLNSPSDQPVWALDSRAQVCAVGDGKITILINKQLAMLDMKTGKQLAYSDRYSQCPAGTFGAYGWMANGDIISIPSDT